MTNNKVSFDVLMRLACEKMMDEEIRAFDSLDCSDIHISRKTDIKFERALRRALFRSSAAYRTLKTVSIACVLIFAILVGTVIFVEPVRARVWQLVTNRTGNNAIKIEFSKGDDDIETGELGEAGFPKLEEGWKVAESYEYPEFGSFVIKSEAGESIVYSYLEPEREIFFDNSTHITEDVELKSGITAYLFTYDKGINVLIWKNIYVYKLSSSDVDGDFLIKMANSIE